MRRLHVPGHVHWAEDESGCVTLLNEHTGRWHLLNPTAAFLWNMAREAPADADVIAALSQRFPDVPQERIHDDVESLLGDLTMRGLLWIETSSTVDNSWNETSMAYQFHTGRRIGAKQLTAAALALPIAIVLSRVPFRWAAKLLRAAKRRLRYPEATAEEADGLAEAAQHVARAYPGRVACYEHSLTVLVAAVLSRRSVTMYLGTATDPRRFHAWIETKGHVVPIFPDPTPGEGYHQVIVL